MSNPVTKHYVEFFSPGTFVSETTSKPIDSWDTKLAVSMSEKILERYGAKPYGFRFFTRVEGVMPDGRGGTLEGSKTVATSGMYFLGGRLETYDQVVARNNPDEQIMCRNMCNNDLWIVCVNTNSYRSTVAFEEDSFVVDAQGNVVERGNDPVHVAYRADAKRLYGDA